MNDLFRKLFDAATWRVLGATACGWISTGYASAREASEFAQMKTPGTGYDIGIARLFGLLLVAYMASKLFLLWRNRKDD